MKRFSNAIPVVLLISMVFVAGPAVAAEISGVVLGPGAAPMPGVTVTVTNPETAAAETAITDERGRYQVDVPAGTYAVTAVLPGFGSVTRDGVVVGADGRAGLDLTVRPEAAGAITVTARKVEENLQDVPISISTISSDEIEQRNVVLFSEAFEEMPNVLVQGNMTESQTITIRGISSNTNNVGIEPAISVYLDEVFLPRPAAFEQSLIDIERVEVLRGPQGTAYGKNTIGGAINMVTIKPSSRPRGSLELSTGNYNLKQVRGFYGGPISGDKVSGQITLGLRQRDGWFENRTEGRDDFQGEDYVGGRGQLRFTPKDSVDILVTADYSQDENIKNAQDVSGGALYAVDGMDGWDRSLATNEDDFSKRDVFGASLRGDFGMRNHLFTTLTAYRTFEAENWNDQDYTFLDILATSRREELDFLSQEFRLTSTSGGDFSYLGGLFYSDRTTKGADVAKLGEMVPILVGAGPIPGYVEGGGTFSEIDEQVLAGFFSGSWAFSERGTFAFGLRYTSEDKAMDIEQQINLFYIAPGVPVGIAAIFISESPLTHFDRTDSDPSGDLNLLYRLSDDVNGYLRYAHGFKAGGFDSMQSAVAVTEREFDSETVDAFELGIKSLLSDNRVQLNAALFYMDYRDKQEQFFDGFNFRTGNAGAVTSKGVDLELKVIPASGLEILGTVGYTDAVYDEYLDELTGEDFSGNRLSDAPEWTGSLAVQYFGPLASTMGWFVRGAAYYRSDSFTDSANNDYILQQASTRIDARAGIDFKNGRYTVALWGKNLTDEIYLTGGFEFFGTTYQGVNAPMTYGIEFRIRR